MAYQDFKNELKRLSSLIKQCQSLQLPYDAEINFMERHLLLQLDVLKQYEHPFNDEQKHRLEISLKTNIIYLNEKLLNLLKKHFSMDDSDASIEQLIKRLQALSLPRPSPKTPRTKKPMAVISTTQDTIENETHPFAKEGPYYEELLAFRNTCKAMQESFEQVPDNPFIKDDPILSQLIPIYEGRKQSLNELINNFENELKQDIAQPGYFGAHALSSKMRRIQSLIPDRSAQLSYCYQKIINRINLICPKFENQDEANLLVSKALTKLQTCIISHLETFCEITIHQQDDKDTEFFIQKLHDFIKTLEQALASKELDLDTNQISLLISRLKNHIGFKRNYILFEKFIINPLPKEDIIPLANGLFKATQFKTANQHKVIARAYQAVDHINMTQFFHVKAFFDNKKEQGDLAVKIQNDTTIIKAHLTLGIDELKHLDSLIGQHECNNRSHLNSMLSALNDYQQQLESLKMPEQYTNYQDDIIKRLVHVKNETQSYREIYQTCSKLKETVLENHSNVEKLYKNILDEYAHYRYQYKTQALNHANKITQLIKVIEPQQKYPALELKLNTYVEHLSQTEETQPLERYQSQEKGNTEYLRLVSEDCCSKLLGQLNGILDRAASHIFTYTKPECSESNYMMEDLNKTIDSVNVLYQRMQTLRSEINYELQERLINKHSDIKTLTDSMERALYTRNILHNKARHVQWRINTQSFEVSSEVVETLNQRFVQLVNKALSAERLPSSDLLSNLRRNPSWLNHRLTPLTADEEKALNHLDPRLSTLYTVREKIDNARYNFIRLINFDRDGHVTDATQKAAEQQFIDELKSASINYLHHQHLYDLSDHEQYRFIQWLRRHVFKPIQHIGHYASSKEYRHNPANRFFVPVLASKTERECANMGIKLIGVTPTA